MPENIKQVVGHVTEKVNEAINEYAKKNNKKKIGLIGEIITNFIEEESDETSSKKRS